MKTLRFSCLLAILFAFITLFTNCDPINPPDPKPDPKDTVALIDSVIVEVTFILPTGATMSASGVMIESDVFYGGRFDKDFYTNDRIFKLIFVKEAKSLIGKECRIYPGIYQGRDPYGRVCSFQEISGGGKTIRIQKGINKVSFEFICV
ncbi:MAG: hypothetical protein WCK78_05630 [Paludibacter sp.]